MAPVDTGVAEVKGAISVNGLAVITLDRPKALNAMNVDMDLAYKKLLADWAADPSVAAVLVEGSTPRAFSSGMDVKGAAAAIREDPGTPLVKQMFTAEYTLICAIKRFPKPYIALMDGVTMGFGLGLAGHGRYRVATEKSLLAMPENGIGLFPDVGFAHLVASSPGDGALGAYLALTGARVSTPEDAIYAGLATHFVPSEQIPALRDALLKAPLGGGGGEGAGGAAAATSEVEKVLAAFARAAPSGGREAPLSALLPPIQRCFEREMAVAQTAAALEAEEASGDPKVKEWAAAAQAGLAKGAPFSLALTQRHLAAVAAAAGGDHELSQIEGVMKAEYRMAVRASLRPDFVEGVRAVLVDKDQKPKWDPPSLEAVDMADIKACFAPLGDGMEELVV